MISLSETALQSLTGSRENEHVSTSVWYAGKCTIPDLAVESWKLTDDVSRQIRRDLTLTFADQTGENIPFLLDDKLAPAGQKLAFTYYLGSGEAIPQGEFMLSKVEPKASWEIYNQRMVAVGAVINLTGVDLTENLRSARLFAPESPPSGATVFSEIKRLTAGILPVWISPDLKDAPVAPSTVYEKERLDAVEDLAAKVGGFLRMSPDAVLQVIPTSTVPVWTLDVGEDGVIVSIDHELALDGLYNACVATSSGGTEQYVGFAKIDSGPLRWDGPLGRRPVFFASPLLGSQASADSAAQTHLERRTTSQVIELSVSCAPHPGIESGDYVKIRIPKDGVNPVFVDGIVKSRTLQGNNAGMLPMELKIGVSARALGGALYG